MIEFVESKEHERYVPIIKANMLKYYREVGVGWNDSEKSLAYSKCDLYIIMDDVEIGFMMLKVIDSELYLAELHIFENYRSRGYGKLAINWAKKYAVGHGFKFLRIRVFRTNPAYNLYTSQGFKFEKDLPYTAQLVAEAHDQSRLPA